MTEVLPTLLDLSVLVFAVASMLSVGFAYSVREITGPLRNVRGVLLMLLANFVLVPLLAYGVAEILPLDRALEVGLLLVATAAGAPFLIKLTEAADGDVALAASLLVLLLLVTMAYMPLVVPLMVPDARVSMWAIASPLMLTMLLPLAAGHAVEAWAPAWAKRLRPIMGRASTVALVVLLTLTVLLNFRGILGVLGTGAILAAVMVVGGAFLIGYLLGGRKTRVQRVMGLGTAQRNIAAATVVATQAVEDGGTLVMVVVTSLVAMALLFPLAWWMASTEAEGAKAAQHRGAGRWVRGRHNRGSTGTYGASR